MFCFLLLSENTFLRSFWFLILSCISFLGLCNKLPQSGRLKTRGIYSLAVPKARILKSRFGRNGRPPKALSLPISVSGSSMRSLACGSIIQSLPHLHIALFFFLCTSPLYANKKLVILSQPFENIPPVFGRRGQGCGMWGIVIRACTPASAFLGSNYLDIYVKLLRFFITQFPHL